MTGFEKDKERVIVTFKQETVVPNGINLLRELLFRKDLNQSPSNPNVYIRETDDPDYLIERILEVFKGFPKVDYQIARYVS
ncbi:MAG: hypothetical protein RIC06_04110 [Cyclobacteriaceae bacterium]